MVGTYVCAVHKFNDKIINSFSLDAKKFIESSKEKPLYLFNKQLLLSLETKQGDDTEQRKLMKVSTKVLQKIFASSIFQKFFSGFWLIRGFLLISYTMFQSSFPILN